MQIDKMFSRDAYADILAAADERIDKLNDPKKRKVAQTVILSKAKEAANLAGLNKPSFRSQVIESMMPRGLVSTYKFAKGFSPRGLTKSEIRSSVTDYTTLLDRDAPNKSLKTPLRRMALHTGSDVPTGMEELLSSMENEWSDIKKKSASSSIRGGGGSSDGHIIEALEQQSKDSVIAAKEMAAEQSNIKEVTTTIQNLKRNHILEAQGEILTRMSNTLHLMQRYQDTFTRKYQTTNLKFQYEQVSLLKALLKVKLTSDKVARAQANALITNTSLPGINKTTIKDLISYNLRARAAGMVSDEIVKYKQLAVRNVKRIFRKNAGLDPVTAAMKRQRLTGVGEDDYLDASSNTFLSRMLDRSKEGIEGSLYGGKLSRVGSIIQAVPRKLNQFVKDNYKEDTIKGKVARTVKGTMDRVGKMSRNIASMPYAIGEKAVFDGRTYTSINTIIPGWLGKISHGVNKISDPKAKKESFIWSSQRFGATSAIKSSIEAAARSMPGVINTKESVNEIMRIINAKHKLPRDLHALVRKMVVEQVAKNAKTDNPLETLTNLQDLLTGETFKSLGYGKRSRIKKAILKTVKSLDMAQVAGIANALLSGSNTGELEQLAKSLITFYGVEPLLQAKVIYPDGGEYYLTQKFIEATIRDSAGISGGTGKPRSFGRNKEDIPKGPSLWSRIRNSLGFKEKKKPKPKKTDKIVGVWEKIKGIFTGKEDFKDRANDLYDTIKTKVKGKGSKAVDSIVGSALDIKSWGEGIASSTNMPSGKERFKGENRLKYVANLVKNATVEGSRFAAKSLSTSIKGVAISAGDKVKDGIYKGAESAAKRFKTAVYGDNEDFKTAIIALAKTGRDKLKDVAIGAKDSVIDGAKGYYADAKEWSQTEGKKKSMSMLDYIDIKIAEGWLGMIPGISREKAAARILLRSEEMDRLEKLANIRSKLVENSDGSSLDDYFKGKKKTAKEKAEEEAKELKKEESKAKIIGKVIAKSLGKAAAYPFKKAASVIKKAAIKVYTETNDVFKLSEKWDGVVKSAKEDALHVKSTIQDAYYSKKGKIYKNLAKKWVNMPDSYKRTSKLNKYVLQSQEAEKKAKEARKGIIKKVKDNPNTLTPAQMQLFTQINAEPALRKRMDEIFQGFKWVEAYYGFKPKNDMLLKLAVVDALLRGDDAEEEELYYLGECQLNATKNKGKPETVEDILDVAKADYYKSKKAKVVSSISTDRPKNYKQKKKPKLNLKSQAEYLDSLDSNVKSLTDFLLYNKKPKKKAKTVLPTYKSMTEQDINESLKKAFGDLEKPEFSDLNNDGNEDGSYADILSRRASRNKKTSSSVKPASVPKSKSKASGLLDMLGPFGKILGGLLSLTGSGLSFAGNIISGAMKMGPLAIPIISSLGIGKLSGMFGGLGKYFSKVPMAGAALGTVQKLLSSVSGLGSLKGAGGMMAAGSLATTLGKGAFSKLFNKSGGSVCGCGVDGSDFGGGGKKKGKKSKGKKTRKGYKTSSAINKAKTVGKAAASKGKGFVNAVLKAPGGAKGKVATALMLGTAAFASMFSSDAGASELPDEVLNGATDAQKSLSTIDGTGAASDAFKKPSDSALNPPIDPSMVHKPEDDISPENFFEATDAIMHSNFVTTAVIPAKIYDAVQSVKEFKRGEGMAAKVAPHVTKIMKQTVSPTTMKLKDKIIGLFSANTKNRLALFKELASMRKEKFAVVVKDIWRIVWGLVKSKMTSTLLGKVMMGVFRILLGFIARVLMPSMMFRDAYIYGKLFGDFFTWGLAQFDIHLGILFYDLMEDFGWNPIIQSMDIDYFADAARNVRAKLGIEKAFNVAELYATDGIEFIADAGVATRGYLTDAMMWLSGKDTAEFLADTPIPNRKATSIASNKPFVGTTRPKEMDAAIKVSSITVSKGAARYAPRTTKSKGRNLAVGWTPEEGADGYTPLTLDKHSTKLRGRHRKYTKFSGSKVYLYTKLDFSHLTLARHVRTTGANKAMLMLLCAMGKDYHKATGQKLYVNSIYRTRADQIRIKRENPSKAATPGHSLHEFGLAIDLNTVTINRLDKLGLLNKYGFVRPLGTESWHIEPIGIQWGVRRAKRDSVYAYNRCLDGVGRGGGGPIGRFEGKLRNDNLMRYIWESGRDVTIVIDGREPLDRSTKSKVTDTPSKGAKIDKSGMKVKASKSMPNSAPITTPTIPVSTSNKPSRYQPYIPKLLADGTINPAYELKHKSDTADQADAPYKPDNSPKINVNVPEPKVVINPDDKLASSVDVHASKTDVTNALLAQVITSLDALHPKNADKPTTPKPVVKSKPLGGDQFGIA